MYMHNRIINIYIYTSQDLEIYPHIPQKKLSASHWPSVKPEARPSTHEGSVATALTGGNPRAALQEMMPY